MQTQTKLKNEIIKELQDMPAENMPKLREIIHYLKTGMKESRKKEKVKKGRGLLLDLRDIAVETGIQDLVAHHDHSLYGVPK